jgi:hypothetical protein
MSSMQNWLACSCAPSGLSCRTESRYAPPRCALAQLAPLGGIDALEAGPAGGVPAGGVAAGAAAWLSAFARLGLRPNDLALLGPDVICADAAAAEAMLRQDSKLAAALDDLASKKALLTRTSYEVPYGRAFDKARGKSTTDTRVCTAEAHILTLADARLLRTGAAGGAGAAHRQGGVPQRQVSARDRKLTCCASDFASVAR